jgi:hypothetical protein
MYAADVMHDMQNNLIHEMEMSLCIVQSLLS